MTKLLRLVYAIWKTGRPFDRNHYAWDTTAADHGSTTEPAGQTDAQASTPATTNTEAQVTTPEEKENAAGLKEQSSENKEVTAAPSSIDQPHTTNNPADSPTDTPATDWIDFDHIRRQITMEQLLKHVGIFDQLRRSGTSRSQYRGTCPIHPANGRRHRTFSVNLDKQAFRCFYPACAAQGNVLHFWAALRGPCEEPEKTSPPRSI